MGAPLQGGLGRADGAVSRDERSEELGISVGCRTVGPVTVLERVQSKTSDLKKNSGRMFRSIMVEI
jgi:hypothetical protein